MKNKKTLLIAGCLTLLCCGAWARATFITNAKAKGANRVRIQITLDVPGAVGEKLTAAEALNFLPEQLKAKAIADFAKQGWTDTTKLNMLVQQKMSNGTWQQVGVGAVEKDKNPCMCCSNNCPACCLCTDSIPDCN